MDRCTLAIQIVKQQSNQYVGMALVHLKRHVMMVIGLEVMAALRIVNQLKQVMNV